MPTVCFTGHRRINGAYYNFNNPTEDWQSLRVFLEAIVSNAVNAWQVERFISGMAIGVDQLAAEIVLNQKHFGGSTHVQLIAAVPFPSQASNWPEATRHHWENIIGSADIVQTISPDPYTPAKMHIRDRWMVDQSEYVIAVWDGRKMGGTYATLTYAVQTGRQIFWINPTLYPIEGVWFNNSNLI